MKKYNKKNKISKLIILLSIFVIAFTLLFCLLFKLINKNNFFKEVDRIENIEKYNKKNNAYKAVGWLRVQGTNIDYPIVEYEDKVLDDVSSDIGWIYDTSNELKQRNVLEGHNILNLSSNPLIKNKNSKRFEQLLSFYDNNFVKDNKYIQYTTNGQNYIFKIFAVGFPYIETYYTQTSMNEEDYINYINEAKKSSLYKFDVDVNADDKIISLYTCTRFYGYDRSVVFRIDGRLIRKGEKLSNYNFEKTDNYFDAKNYAKNIESDLEEDSI